jgi:hypothetical protein
MSSLRQPTLHEVHCEAMHPEPVNEEHGFA